MAARKLRVFLCHASQDKPVVRDLYKRLAVESWIEPWLDEEKLLPGQDWDLEIEKTLESVEVVIVCLSNRSVTKEGYVQKEIRRVLDIALEKPEETIFIIPLRLEECELPRRLRTWHYVDYFPAEQRDRAHQRLLQSLSLRQGQLSPHARSDQAAPPDPVLPSDIRVDPKETTSRISMNRREDASKPKANADVGVSLLLIIYFAIAAMEAFTSSSDTVEFLLGSSAILAGVALLFRREIPATVIFRIPLIIYLVIYGQGYRLTNPFPVLFYTEGIAAVVSGLVLALTIRVPMKPAFYSSISFASFLFLVGIYELGTNIGYSSITNTVDILILLTSIITSILVFLDL
jgi:hypothetical protein